MPAVTQLIPNLLGGVSTQADNKKLQGQVVEAVNAYPDPTFGMLKRNGMNFIRTVNKADGTPFAKDELKDAAWFFIQRGPSEAYFGAIKDSNIYVWNGVTGAVCTVTNNGAGYLTGTKPEDYHFRSIQDVTVITNKTVNPKLLAAPTNYTAGKVGTVVLKIVEYSATYQVTIDGTDCEYKTRNADELDPDKTQDRLNATEVLTGIKDAIEAKNLGVTVTQYKTSLELTKSTPFTLSCKGGINNQALESFQDSVTDVSKLPEESYDGRIVRVLNAGGDEDDYWLAYSAANKEWKETVAPNVSKGFDPSTMPHELANVGVDAFEFGPIKWKERLSGDDVTNPPPSIFDYDVDTDTYETVGNPITATFFYNNRFGLLSEDNVIMSQSNDPYNFFSSSALTQVDSDPIDLNASSVRPVTLFDVLPNPQGLLIFSRRQQFLLFAADTGVLSPRTTVIRGISNYEMDDNIPPVDIGTTVGFVSKVPAYTRAFTMQTRGLEENPIILDLSKVVAEYIPNDITSLVASPQNSFIALAGRDTKEMYIYRYYNNGEKDLFQAWVRWTMPGNLQAFTVVNDMMFAVSQQMDQYTLGVISINDIPLGAQLTSMVTSNPTLDMSTKPTSIVYDTTTKTTKLYVGYTPIDGLTPIMLLTLPAASGTLRTIFDLAGFQALPTSAETDADPGYWAPATVGNDAQGDYFAVDGDFTSYGDGIVVGYNYDFEIELPKFYFNRDANATEYDYTANLTVSRVKLAVGKSGVVTFKLKAKGSNEWVDIQHVSDADYYEADTAPVKDESLFTVPIHQRNMNFSLKITSNLPFPVSLVSMMWEGNYTPRYYKRT